MDEDARRRVLAGPFHGLRDQFAVSVFLGDVGDNQGRQPTFDRQRLAAMRDSAFGLQVLDEELQSCFRVALHAEGAGDVAFGHSGGRSLAVGRGRAADIGDHVLARRERSGSRLHGAYERRFPSAGVFFDFAMVPFLKGPQKRAPRAVNVSSMVRGNKPRRWIEAGCSANRLLDPEQREQLHRRKLAALDNARVGAGTRSSFRPRNRESSDASQARRRPFPSGARSPARRPPVAAK